MELDIRAVETALAALGMSRRQRRALLKGGWSAVVDAQRAELDEARLALAELRHTLGEPIIALPVSDAVARGAGPHAGDAAPLLPEQR